MIVEIITGGPIAGSGELIRLDASQIVIRQNNGTPLCVAMECGDKRATDIACFDDPDFNDVLSSIGIPVTVTQRTVQCGPPPSGARLVRGPLRS